MTSVRDLHNEAMRLSFHADMAREGGIGDPVDLFRQALALEEQACERIPLTRESEPTRSILYLSAASLAWKADDTARCLVLIEQAMAGWPSGRIMAGLDDLGQRCVAA